MADGSRCKCINEKILAAMRLRETPVPIPNTMVKPQAADGTMLETAWESRRLPDQKKRRSPEGGLQGEGPEGLSEGA